MREVANMEKDFDFFEGNRSEWASQHQGEFALVCKQQSSGFYETYEEAYLAAIQRFGLGGEFLIQQVCVVEPVFTIY